MTVLVDLNPVMISTLMVQIGFSNKRTSVDLNEHFLRHLIINTLRSYNVKYGKEKGPMILCADPVRSWRYEYFPYYKAGRKTARDNSTLDWPMIFKVFGKIREEIKEFLPYKVMEVPRAEADDIIGTLAIHLSEKGENVLIVSSDKDFKQLAIYPGITQYSPILQTMIREKDPKAFLKEHIIRGEPSATGDGIPNILSNDDSLITKVGKKNLNGKMVEKWMALDYEQFCTNEMLRNWKRNEMLIDLTMTPDDIKQAILTEFEVPKEKVLKRQTLNYLMGSGLRNIISMVEDF